MKIPIELSKKNQHIVFTCTERLTFVFFQINLNVDLKNIEIWLSHGLKPRREVPRPSEDVGRRDAKFSLRTGPRGMNSARWHENGIVPTTDFNSEYYKRRPRADKGERNRCATLSLVCSRS